jgi:hypothetical protein
MKTSIKKILYISFTLTTFLMIFWFTLYTIIHSDLWDFNVFYSSAQTTLQGGNIYHAYGAIDLPYWYFPWVSWFFIPLAIFPFETAKIIYTFITFLSTFFIIHSIGRYFNSQLSLANQMLMAAMSVLMCWLLFRVGQVDFILAALITVAIFLIDKKQNFQAGLLFPIFLFKPHLLVIFIPFAILRGGRNFILSALLSLLLASLTAFILIPNWPNEMLRMIGESGQRTDNIWGFTTFPALIGGKENWLGTANLPITIILMLLAFITVWKNQHLSTVPFLAFTLTASLLCAPRAYSYNFPFLIPTLLWLSAENTTLTALLWISLGILSLATNFSTGAYLIVIASFALSILKAHKLIRVAI